MDKEHQDVKYKVMKSLTWESKGYSPGTEASPVFIWLTEAEAKDWLADGTVVAA